MAIRKKIETGEKRVIDLTGPHGNAYYLLATATTWSKQMDLDTKKIHDEMTSGDYENLIEVFDKYFGKVCDLER